MYTNLAVPTAALGGHEYYIAANMTTAVIRHRSPRASRFSTIARAPRASVVAALESHGWSEYNRNPAIIADIAEECGASPRSRFHTHQADRTPDATARRRRHPPLVKAKTESNLRPEDEVVTAILDGVNRFGQAMLEFGERDHNRRPARELAEAAAGARAVLLDAILRAAYNVWLRGRADHDAELQPPPGVTQTQPT